MDSQHFDELMRTLAQSRRSLVAGALTAAAGLLGIQAATARRRKPRKPRAQPNEFGCVDAGKPCQNNGSCCSGVCKGKKGRKRCQAHHTGTCKQGGAGHCLESSVETCNDRTDCACVRTTSGSDVCVQTAPSGFDYCADCARDTDCEALGYPRGSVCLPLHEGFCAGACDSDRACFVPCGAEWPLP